MKKNKIGIFGGTFNPIHYGHLSSMDQVQEKAELDQVLVIPAHQNPMRSRTEGPTPDERLMMAQLGVKSLNNELIEVSPMELERGGDSYTVDTLSALREKHSDSEFYLIIGGDQIESFDKWKEFEKILEMSNLIVTSRPGSELPKLLRQMPTWLKDRLDDFENGEGLFKSGKSLSFISLTDVDVSATEVRRMARRGLDVRKDVPTDVAEYIVDNKIYDRAGSKIPNFLEFAKFCYKVLDDKGGINIQAFDVTEIEQPTDFTLVLSGTSSRHVSALSDYLTQGVKDEYGVYPLGLEGATEGRWVVIDYGGAMIHIFYDFVRNEYKIEDLWRAGKRLEL